jgi:hypothetical protein
MTKFKVSDLIFFDSEEGSGIGEVMGINEHGYHYINILQIFTGDLLPTKEIESYIPIPNRYYPYIETYEMVYLGLLDQHMLGIDL